MQYGRVNLTKTNYELYNNASILINPNIEALNTIYIQIIVDIRGFSQLSLFFITKL